MIGLILAAAGGSQRFHSGTPKQFVSAGSRPLYLRALEPFLDYVDEVALVVPASRLEEIRSSGAPARCRLEVVAGGERRQDSVQCGLAALSDSVETVLVHDAARPFLSSDLVERVLAGTSRWGACIPAIEVADTVKAVDGEFVTETLDRRRLRLVQTPQGFSAQLLREAYRALAEDPVEVTDESALVERLGHRVAVVAGERGNRKVTWPDDLEPGTGEGPE